MQIPRLKKFCCCLSLRAGSAIVGVLFVLWFLWHVIKLSEYAVRAANESKGNGDVLQYVAGVVASAITMMLNVALLYGVRKRDPAPVNLWMDCCVGMWLGHLIVLLGFGADAFVKGLPAAGGTYLGAAVGASVIYSYCLIVVRSYYLDLKEYNPPVKDLHKNYGTIA